MPVPDDPEPSGAGLALGRSRREAKTDSLNKFEQLRAAVKNGQKHKYQVKEVVPVYAMVDEDEYSKIVSDRQKDHQFVVDGDGDYYDDGREIFDDDSEWATTEKQRLQTTGKKGKKQGKGGKGQSQQEETADVEDKKKSRQGKLADFFADSRGKKKETTETLSVDKEALLDDIMEELNGKDYDEPKSSSSGNDIYGPRDTARVEFFAPPEHEDIFKKTTLRKKVRPPASAMVDDSPAPVATTSGQKRLFPISPVKSITSGSTSHDASVSQITRAPALQSLLGQTSHSRDILKRHKPAAPVESASSRLTWGEESNDTSNASYEVDPVGQDVGVFDEMDDGWTFDNERLGMSELAVQPPIALPPPAPIVIKTAVRPLQKIEKKWSMPTPDTTSKPAIALNDDSELSGMQSSGSSTRIYWLDVCEDPAMKGCVNIFGKTLNREGRLVSVCIKVMNIQRQLFFLMRKKMFDPEDVLQCGKDVTKDDVKMEFENYIMSKYKIAEFRSAAKTKKYAFEKAEVPNSAEYLEVRYAFSEPELPEDLSGQTFSHVFGRTTSALEILLVERKIKGPCWLDILDAVPSQTKSTWCNLEFVAHSPVKVILTKCDIKPPGIIVMALQMKIVVDRKTKHNEIVAVAGLAHPKFPLSTAAPKPLFDAHFVIVAQDSRPGATTRRFPRTFKSDVDKQKKYCITPVDGEKALLEALLTRIQAFDPDLLVFHDAVGHHLDILLQRLTVYLKGQNWSKLGRLHRSIVPKGRYAGVQAATGRLICDIKHSAEELIHTKSYDLSELVQVVLKDPNPRQEIESDAVKDMFRTTDDLILLVDNTLVDAEYILRIMAELNALPLALQITNIAGNVLSRTLLGGRSERNEFLLLHAFTAKNYICPDKQFRDFHKKDTKSGPKKGQLKLKNASQDEEATDDQAVALIDEEKENPLDEIVGQVPDSTQAPSGKRKPAYAGGLVLDPKKGLYDSYILLMDFNSLYPSIIQEFNICFTTVDRQAMAANAKQEDFLPDVPDSSVETGVLPTEIRFLVERRQEVKKLIKQLNGQDSDKMIELDIRQKALKLTANSMYGCLGFNASRFFARPLAALITSKGREILMSTKELIEKQEYEVIYGDTDSVMINTRSLDWDAVAKIGSEIKYRVDKHYKAIKLDVDGVFRSLLLLQKKKYAALVASKKDGKLTFTRELKGLDIVRRDWSQLAADAGRFVIDQIFADPTANQTRDDVQGQILTGMKSIGDFMKTNGDDKTPLSKLFDNKYFIGQELDLYVITKQLNKDPQLYGDAKSLPHVQVAQRWNQTQLARPLRQGSTVPYVICNEAPPGGISMSGKKIPHTQRAYHVEEVRSNCDTLSIDKQYYLAEQVHKVVRRLCEPIAGIDSVTLAECLGIDKSAYASYYMERSADDDDEKAQTYVSDGELYKDCLPLTMACPECGNNWMFDEPIWEKDECRWLSLLKCGFCDAKPFDHLIKIQNGLRLQIGLQLQRYYKPVFICKDAHCFYRCSFIPPKFHQGQPVCPKCLVEVLRVEFSDRDLYLQLCYWKNAFDPARALEKIRSKSWHGVLEAASKDPLLSAGYDMLMKSVQTFLDQSAYGRVNLRDFFPAPQKGLF